MCRKNKNKKELHDEQIRCFIICGISLGKEVVLYRIYVCSCKCICLFHSQQNIKTSSWKVENVYCEGEKDLVSVIHK